MVKKNVLGIQVTLGSYSAFLNEIIDLTRKQEASYICVSNVHMLVEAHKDDSFSKVVNGADMCTPDGMPLVWALNLIHDVKQDRVAGMDLLPDLLPRLENEAIPIYIYGGTNAMLDQTSTYFRQKYPRLKVAGMHSPPFRELSREEDIEIAQKINSSGARLVFVVLGCPKQEKWMAKMKAFLKVPMIGVGGALPVLIGLQPRAPKWLQKSGLEWLYRLLGEPKRLFKRYAETNTIFIYLLVKNLMMKQFDTKKAH